MIDILMTTYNGEKYLTTQLDSLLCQTFKDWHLYVQDDCSTDSTLSILKKYSEQDSRITVIDNNKKLGAGKNFLSLLKYSKSDFIAFCDQDDYWFENKLEILHEEINKLNNDKPILLVSNCLVWQYPSNNISKNFNFVMPKELNDIFFMGGMQGCLTIFNKALKKVLDQNYEYIWLHDHYLLLAAMTFGEIHYIIQPLMLYRQHNSNTTAHFSQKTISDIKKKIYENRFMQRVELFNETKEFFRLHQDRMPDNKKKQFLSFLSLVSLSYFKRFFRLIFSKYTIGGSSHMYFVLKVIMKPKFIG